MLDSIDVTEYRAGRRLNGVNDFGVWSELSEMKIFQRAKSEAGANKVGYIGGVCSSFYSGEIERERGNNNDDEGDG
ncbi:hypothetical protein L2E82_16624 [Cichorium intybus]|uniref:Uncharacterized protein n=1 Tax=Cichorium intybus TaxID=13427 RepID=A0ACB9F630_CICIN|nr:hypothetical protein L2E82_16624 [Cichorium intybus]